MSANATHELVVLLANRATRAEGARRLAAKLGIASVLLLVCDPALNALIPAPEMPQTLRGGRTWRSFIKRCSAAGRHVAEVELPLGTYARAEAIVSRGTALVLVGGEPAPDELAIVEKLLPLICATLKAEQDAVVARAEAVSAKDAADRAQALASALEAARADAAKLNTQLRNEHRSKDEFLAMLGHELRNPLAPLVTSIALLRRHPVAPDTLKKLVGVMARQTDQLSRLVDDLLDVSRVSRGRIELKLERIVLADAIADALDESRPLIEAQQHELIVSACGEPLTVYADRARLTQVFGNLLNNAGKYTPPGGRVELSMRREGEEAVVQLEDNGVGISAEMLPAIFELFTQAPVSLDRSQGGLGIGLTLVRNLVELHGGRVSAESPGVGRGSTFSVRLPLMDAPAHIASAPAKPGERRSARGEGLRVLVVDDNEDAAQSLAALLQLMGHHTHVAHDGVTAISIAPAFGPDVVLLDIGLPGMDGYEVVRHLRPITRENTQFVALTGYGSEDGKRRSQAAGFGEHIVKPISPQALGDLLARAAKGLETT